MNREKQSRGKRRAKAQADAGCKGGHEGGLLCRDALPSGVLLQNRQRENIGHAISKMRTHDRVASGLAEEDSARSIRAKQYGIKWLAA
jgi:hypothetical protein